MCRSWPDVGQASQYVTNSTLLLSRLEFELFVAFYSHCFHRLPNLKPLTILGIARSSALQSLLHIPSQAAATLLRARPPFALRVLNRPTKQKQLLWHNLGAHNPATGAAPTMASEDVRYRQSTQYRLWSFSPVQLASTREQTNALARSNISERLLSNPPPPSLKPPIGASDPASGANTPDPQAQAQQQQQQQQAEPFTLPEFLTPAEELQLLNYYTVELLRAANHFNLRSPMLASAAVFLRRFYVTNSIMTYPPAEMLKTCLFFGCKAEGYYPKNTTFAAQFPKTTGEGILAGEFLLCQGIRFAFDVKHPFRALEGAVLELRRYGDIDVCFSLLLSGQICMC